MKKRLCFILVAAMVVGMAQTSFVYADDKSDDKEFAGTTLRFLDVSQVRHVRVITKVHFQNLKMRQVLL